MNSNNLYIFIDESGNFDFSSSGTKHFVLTAITTVRPLKGRVKLQKLRYRLLEEGENQECFHATEDKQDIRDRFFDVLNKFGDFEIDSVVAQKNKTNPSLFQETKIYKNSGKAVTKNMVLSS